MPAPDETILNLAMDGEYAAANAALSQGHPDAFLDTVVAAVLRAANAGQTTSASSVTIGTGAKVFTLANARNWPPGTPVYIMAGTNPATNIMYGTVTTEVSGVLTVEVVTVGGSGTFTSWTLLALLAVTSVVSPPVAIADGGTGATTARQAVLNLEISLTRFAQEYANEPVSPPGFGDLWYLVGPAGTGDFLGEDGNWAFTDDGGSTWTFYAPTEGDVAIVLRDWITPTPSGDEGNFAAWVYDGSNWEPFVMPRVPPLEFSSNTTLQGLGNVNHPVTAIKTGTGTPTLTLPAAWSVSPLRPVIVINRGASGTLTVNVASSGTIDGGASASVNAGTVKQFIYSGTSGVWYSL